MAANTLVITKAYRDGIAFTEAIVDGIRSDLQSWGQDAVDNLNQMRLDVFGSSYAYDNDGLANNTNPMNVQQTITPTATITGLSLAGASLTTGTGIDINTLDALSTGFGLRVRSNSTDVGTRFLVDILNDNTAATAALCLRSVQDSTADNVEFQSTGNSRTLFVNKDGTGIGTAFHVDNEGTGYAMVVESSTDNNTAIIEGENATMTTDILVLNAIRAANTAYDFLTARSGDSADVEVRLRGDGEVSGDAAAYVTPAADYAEMFECIDQKGIEPGYFVTLEKDTGMIRKATSKDKYILGTVSGKPAVVADTDWNRWAHKYLYDEFNRYLFDEAGNRILNPKFNPRLIHATRMERPEWVPVALLGKVNVRTAEDITEEFIDVNSKGLAVNGITYRVLSIVRQKSKDPDKTGYGVVKIIFRGKE